MNSFTLFLALAFCATLVCRTETEECKLTDKYRCGYMCHGENNTCTCGNQFWEGKSETHGCCPSSPDSCIKDNDGKNLYKKGNKYPHFVNSFIFTGNVICTQGTEMQIGEVAPAEDDFASIYGKIDRRCKYGNHCENKNNR